MQKRPKSANRVDDVRTLGGKELIMNRLVNHYKALANVKAKVENNAPRKHIDYGKQKQNNQIKDQFYNIRQTYKAVAHVKSVVDSNQPNTFNLGKKLKHLKTKEIFDDTEHVRRLNAMSKRILSIGKPHERRKNQNDPFANPTYFFRRPGDDKAVQLISLDKFNEKLKELNTNEHNKLLLGDVIYQKVENVNDKYDNRPKSAMNRNSSHTSTFMKYNSNNDFNKNNKIVNKTIYTHIFTNPEEIIKQHMKERILSHKENDRELLNLTKTSSKLNKSNLNTFNNFNKTTNTKFITNDTKIIFPIFSVETNSPKQNMNEDFQMKIIKYIIAKRIYKETDMDWLLKQLIQKNRDFISEEEIKNIYLHVKEELDK